MAEQTVSEQLKDLSASELKLFDDIWNRRLTPNSSVVKSVHNYKEDYLTYYLKEVYSYKDSIVKASLEIEYTPKDDEHELVDLSLEFP